MNSLPQCGLGSNGASAASIRAQHRVNFRVDSVSR